MSYLGQNRPNYVNVHCGVIKTLVRVMCRDTDVIVVVLAVVQCGLLPNLAELTALGQLIPATPTDYCLGISPLTNPR